MSTWEPIKSQGRLVYWCRRLGDSGYLAVSPDSITAPQWWNWEHRGPQDDPADGTKRLHARGDPSVRSAATARRHADRYLAGGLGGDPRQRFTPATEPAGTEG
jgi:hypothetical protein